MKTKLLFTLFLLPFSLIFSQEWVQLAGDPEGGGVTDIFVNEISGELFVTTGSLNWPGGEDGGIRKSTDDGATWINLFDAYTSRFIMMGPDGNLYASIWDYPADEGLYRSTDNGNTWTLLISVPTGNNIFACAIKEGSTNIIYAGTSQGVYKSIDNGATWAYSNAGLPIDKLVRSLAVSPDGNTIAAGTVSGLYVSSDDGNNWDQVTGDGEGEIISSVMFDFDPTKGNKSEANLYFGSENGILYLTTILTLYSVAYLCATIAPGAGITRIMAQRHPSTFNPTWLVSLYAATGGAFFFAVTNVALWVALMNGLPSNPMISMFTSYMIASTAVMVMYIAFYGNNINGATVFKTTMSVSTDITLQPYTNDGMELFQNIPNPFNGETWINFRLSETGQTTLKIFDLAGKEVKSLLNSPLDEGKHSIKVTKEGLKPGIYYYVLESNNFIQTKKLAIR
jgi:hypothetical protein